MPECFEAENEEVVVTEIFDCQLPQPLFLIFLWLAKVCDLEKGYLCLPQSVHCTRLPFALLVRGMLKSRTCWLAACLSRASII
jgi:hypothetical protein